MYWILFLIRIVFTFLRNLFMTPKRVRIELNKLLSELEAKAGDKISTRELVDIIFNFCELYSSVTFYPYQEQFSKRIIRSVLENDGAEITALFSRQSGKSETIATTCGGMMIMLPRLAMMPMFANDERINRFADGMWIGIFAPSLRQSQITYMRMKKRLQCKAAKAVLADPDFNYQFTTSNGQTVGLSNGSFATSLSASEGSNIEGESFKFIICEECQDISNYKIRKSIHPMGAAYNATIAKIGTATTFKGDFYEAIERNKRDYKSGRARIKNHFEYNYKVVMKYNPQYEKYVTKELYRLGEDSDEFQMAYNLKWILARGMFIDIKKFEKNNGVSDGEHSERVYYDRKNTHVVGIDVACKSDSTVITPVEVDWNNPVIEEKTYNEETGQEETFIAYRTDIKDWKELTGDNYEIQYYEILDYLQNYKISKIVIDATRESSIAHRLAANLPIEVIPFVFGSATKSELYKHLDGEIRSKRAHYPNSEQVRQTPEHKKFTQQMEDLQKDYSGKYLVVAHPDTKGAHDDYPDSWALAVWGAKEPSNCVVGETTANPMMQKTPVMKTRISRTNNITARRR